MLPMVLAILSPSNKLASTHISNIPIPRRVRSHSVMTPFAEPSKMDRTISFIDALVPQEDPKKDVDTLHSYFGGHYDILQRRFMHKILLLGHRMSSQDPKIGMTMDKIRQLRLDGKVHINSEIFQAAIALRDLCERHLTYENEMFFTDTQMLVQRMHTMLEENFPEEYQANGNRILFYENDVFVPIAADRIWFK